MAKETEKNAGRGKSDAKMKYVPEYPSPGLQHTSAVVALTVTTMCLDLFHPAPRSAMEKHMAKIRRWADACAEKTKTKRLSAGAKRALERCCAKLTPHVPTAATPDNARFRMWAALVWTAWTFVLDVRNTCPLYSGGRDGQCWRYLLRVLETLAEGVRQIEPDVDVDGTDIYEPAAWALVGVDKVPLKEGA